MKSLAIAGLFIAVTLVGPMAVAQTPPTNVSPKLHPNLAAAQRLTKRAYAKVLAAQEANEFDLDGHAAKAKDLLDQADTELKAAALASNANH